MSEVVDVEPFADRPITDREVYLKHYFVCVWYCWSRCSRGVAIRQIEHPAVIRPLEAKGGPKSVVVLSSVMERASAYETDIKILAENRKAISVSENK
jgi:hypothetical protein